MLLAVFEVSGTVAAYSVEEITESPTEIKDTHEATENPDTGVMQLNIVAISAAAVSLMLVTAGKKRK